MLEKLSCDRAVNYSPLFCFFKDQNYQCQQCDAEYFLTLTELIGIDLETLLWIKMSMSFLVNLHTPHSLLEYF